VQSFSDGIWREVGLAEDDIRSGVKIRFGRKSGPARRSGPGDGQRAHRSSRRLWWQPLHSLVPAWYNSCEESFLDVSLGLVSVLLSFCSCSWTLPGYAVSGVQAAYSSYISAVCHSPFMHTKRVKAEEQAKLKLRKY